MGSVPDGMPSEEVSSSLPTTRVDRLLRERIRRNRSHQAFDICEDLPPEDPVLETVPEPPSQARLVVVANRLPVTCSKDATGRWQLQASAGGLVSALKGVSNYMTLWIGWPGIWVKPGKERDELTSILKSEGFSPVWMEPSLLDLYYNGFCNSVLWQLFHYVPLNIDTWQKMAEHRAMQMQWTAYQMANSKFSDGVLSEYVQNDVVWVQDYHLMLLPSLLKMAVPKMKVGFFLHTPFPSSEMYRTLPVREEVLRAVLAADLVGFHTYDYARHFISSCTRILGLEGTPEGVENNGVLTRVGTFPIGIDPERFMRALESVDVARQTAQLLNRYAGRKIMLGVDRLDMVKGIPQKLLAYEKFLEEHPEWRDKVLLVQIAVPSRTDVPEYQKLRSMVHEIVGRINGQYGTLTYVPIYHLDTSLSFTELCALYAVTDVAMVTSLRDGMNLVSYEYVACQSDNAGVLVLSEFAGAAQSLGAGALLVNPWNISDMAQAIFDALSMSEEERRERHRQNYMHVQTHTAQHWADTFITELNDTHIEADLRMRHTPPPLDVQEVVRAYQSSKRRLIVLGYNATLTTSVEAPRLPKRQFEQVKALAKVNPRVMQSVVELCTDPNNVVVIFSGSETSKLEEIFGPLPVWLAAENGVYVRPPLLDASSQQQQQQHPRHHHHPQPQQQGSAYPTSHHFGHSSQQAQQGDGSHHHTHHHTHSQHHTHHTHSQHHHAHHYPLQPRHSSGMAAGAGGAPGGMGGPSHGGGGGGGAGGEHGGRHHGGLQGAQAPSQPQQPPQWKCVFDQVHCEWMESVQLVFDYFCERTPRSFVEARETSLVWNYKYADVEFGRIQARDLLQHLWTGPISNAPVEIIQGGKSVEVRPVGVTKGLAMQRLVGLIAVEGGREAAAFDMVLCIGHLLGRDENLFSLFEGAKIDGAAPAHNSRSERFAAANAVANAMAAAGAGGSRGAGGGAGGGGSGGVPTADMAGSAMRARGTAAGMLHAHGLLHHHHHHAHPHQQQHPQLPLSQPLPQPAQQQQQQPLGGAADLQGQRAAYHHVRSSSTGGINLVATEQDVAMVRQPQGSGGGAGPAAGPGRIPSGIAQALASSPAPSSPFVPHSTTPLTRSSSPRSNVPVPISGGLGQPLPHGHHPKQQPHGAAGNGGAGGSGGGAGGGPDIGVLPGEDDSATAFGDIRVNAVKHGHRRPFQTCSMDRMDMGRVVQNALGLGQGSNISVADRLAGIFPPKNLYTCTVGRNRSKARYALATSQEVGDVLEALVQQGIYRLPPTAICAASAPPDFAPTGLPLSGGGTSGHGSHNTTGGGPGGGGGGGGRPFPASRLESVSSTEALSSDSLLMSSFMGALPVLGEGHNMRHVDQFASQGLPGALPSPIPSEAPLSFPPSPGPLAGDSPETLSPLPSVPPPTMLNIPPHLASLARGIQAADREAGDGGAAGGRAGGVSLTSPYPSQPQNQNHSHNQHKPQYPQQAPPQPQQQQPGYYHPHQQQPSGLLASGLPGSGSGSGYASSRTDDSRSGSISQSGSLSAVGSGSPLLGLAADQRQPPHPHPNHQQHQSPALLPLACETAASDPPPDTRLDGAAPGGLAKGGGAASFSAAAAGPQPRALSAAEPESFSFPGGTVAGPGTTSGGSAGGAAISTSGRGVFVHPALVARRDGESPGPHR